MQALVAYKTLTMHNFKSANMNLCPTNILQIAMSRTITFVSNGNVSTKF